MKTKLEQYAIRRIRKPTVQGGLHSTVLVEGQGYVDIGFSISLVRAAGMVLPRGISLQDAAYLRAKFDTAKARWVISVQYIASKQKYVLWEMAETPPWLKSVRKINGTKKEKKDGNHQAHHALRSPAARSTRDIPAGTPETDSEAV